MRWFCGPKRLSKILTTKKKVILFLLKKSRMYRRVTSSTLDRFARKVYRRGVAFFVNLRGAAFGMPLFAEVLSTKDCKNTYKSNIKDSTSKRNVFSFLVFSLFFVGKRDTDKKYEFSLSLRSAVFFFFFAYRSAEGDDEDELSVFELSLLVVLFFQRRTREEKTRHRVESFFYQLFPREKNTS